MNSIVAELWRCCHGNVHERGRRWASANRAGGARVTARVRPARESLGRQFEPRTGAGHGAHRTCMAAAPHTPRGAVPNIPTCTAQHVRRCRRGSCAYLSVGGHRLPPPVPAAYPVYHPPSRSVLRRRMLRLRGGCGSCRRRGCRRCGDFGGSGTRRRPPRAPYTRALPAGSAVRRRNHRPPTARVSRRGRRLQRLPRNGCGKRLRRRSTRWARTTRRSRGRDVDNKNAPPIS